MPNPPRSGLHVAVTGPTGDIGKAFIRALEAAPEVERVTGMARSPFDPTSEGWTKTSYLQGDVLDKDSVEILVKDADVVVHLAFIIFTSDDETKRINIEGSRNIFEAAIAAGAQRLVYTSSVAAYGFHDDNPDLLTEDVPARGSEQHAYSAQKAAVEEVLWDVTTDAAIDTYVFRPCIVAGPTALSLIEAIPYVQWNDKVPNPLKKFASVVPPVMKPVIPDPGTEFQLVHEDDVASALLAAVKGEGEPGVYNLAGDGNITVTDLAHSLGWYAMPMPELLVDATVKLVERAPVLPTKATWVHAIKTPVLMDTTRTREVLGWEPRYDALETLAETVAAARRSGLLKGER